MLKDEQAPESLTIRSALGNFRMSCDDSGVFTGAANSFDLVLSVIESTNNFNYSCRLSSDNEAYGFEPVEMSGEFYFFSDIVSMISSWVDNVCSEIIEDFPKDVRYLSTSNGKLAYWAYNTHLDTTPVVFIHGGPGGDSNPVKARRLMLDNPVYLYDQMGCGLSDPIEDLDNWDVGDYVEEMKCFIDSIPSDKVIVYGASWGGGLTAAYADASSCRNVAALILANPFLSARNWTEDAEENLKAMGGNFFQRMKRCIEEEDYGDEFRQIFGEYNARYLFNTARFREYGIESAKEEPNEVFKVLCGPNDMVTNGKLKDFDVTGALLRIDVPTLFICGDSDEVRIERIMEYHSMVKGSRLSIVPHAGHVLAFEQFDSFRAAFKAFLEENGF